jgi:hypothetical protein
MQKGPSAALGQACPGELSTPVSPAQKAASDYAIDWPEIEVRRWVRHADAPCGLRCVLPDPAINLFHISLTNPQALRLSVM